MIVNVCGAGGFIGGHLVADLLADGHQVRAVDRKPLRDWYQVHDTPSLELDLSHREHAYAAVAGCDWVYDLAADMGGMGFIENNKALCMMSVLTGAHLLQASQESGVQRFFFASSACVYPDYRQKETAVTALKESDAYPAMPEDGYGWEKLFMERLCRHFYEDFGLETRVARLHNVYGPHGTYEGGREKAPAAICRKVIEAIQDGSDEIEIWGDGEQTRSFMYITDCIKGIKMIMRSDFRDPINLGTSEMVSINELVDVVEEIEHRRFTRRYDQSAPQGVRGRNSDNTLILERFGWEPETALRDGMRETYEWIKSQYV